MSDHVDQVDDPAMMDSMRVVACQNTNAGPNSLDSMTDEEVLDALDKTHPGGAAGFRDAWNEGMDTGPVASSSGLDGGQSWAPFNQWAA